MHELGSEACIFSIALRPPDPASAFDDGEPRGDFHAGDFRDKDEMMELPSCCVSCCDQLTDPCTARLSDVVFDQRAGIEVIESHTESVTALYDNLAQRRVEGQALHETEVILLFLFWQGIPLSGQMLFLGSRITHQAFGFEPSQDLFQIRKLARSWRCLMVRNVCQTAYCYFQTLDPCFKFS
jgi:hypothetical protein